MTTTKRLQCNTVHSWIIVSFLFVAISKDDTGEGERFRFEEEPPTLSGERD